MISILFFVTKKAPKRRKYQLSGKRLQIKPYSTETGRSKVNGVITFKELGK